MKKIFWLSCVACLSFMFAGISTHAQSDAVTSAVFKIQAYSYNTLSAMYELKQYGSAVLVAKDILLTNAHVITDDDNKLTLQYEACQTTSSTQSPTCFSTLQLLSYDIDEDLALLKIVTPTSDMPTPVTLGSGTLSVGAAISIIGYPSNGGDSITTTQGTIAGFEDGYYKTDANIDGGNSGGGGFDSAGNLIGIPTFVIDGYSTMGYLIPIATVKEFIAGEFGTAYRGKVPTTFTKRIESQYALATQKNITNSLFTTPDLSGYALTLASAIEKKANNLYEYGLSNENEGSVRLRSLIATDDVAIQKYIANEIKLYKSRDMTTQKVTKKIGSMTRQIIIAIDDDTVVYEYIQSHSTNKTYLEFGAMLDTDDAKMNLTDTLNFIESIALKKSSTKAQVLNLPAITLSSKRGVSIVKSISSDGLSIQLFPKSNAFSMEITASTATKGDTLKKVINSIETAFDSMGVDYETETSKYPTKIAFISVTDEDGNQKIIGFGPVKSGSTTVFIQCATTLNTTAGKKEAITLMYKIFGLE